MLNLEVLPVGAN